MIHNDPGSFLGNNAQSLCLWVGQFHLVVGPAMWPFALPGDDANDAFVIFD